MGTYYKFVNFNTVFYDKTPIKQQDCYKFFCIKATLEVYFFPFSDKPLYIKVHVYRVYYSPKELEQHKVRQKTYAVPHIARVSSDHKNLVHEHNGTDIDDAIGIVDDYLAAEIAQYSIESKFFDRDIVTLKKDIIGSYERFLRITSNA